MRTTPAAAGRLLPNIGQNPGNAALKRVAQSDTLGFWAPMDENWETSPYIYSSLLTIGTDSYNDGGMIIHIHAQSAVNENWINAAEAFEAAYRSVFVFNNSALNGNDNRRNIGAGLGDGGFASVAAPFQVLNLVRMYIRGGDNTSGEPSIPNFPIARDRSLSNKARLMTPFIISDTVGFGTGGIITDDDIVEEYESHGGYLWIWVTWGVNVYAYIDFFSGQMHEEFYYHEFTKDFYGSYVSAKEYYPVIPGRTTVVESRGGWNGLGWGANFPYIGPVVQSPQPRDRPQP